jgi:hypothetical protein
MVKYPNAASGIKKVFLAKIIGVIGVPLAFIPGIGTLLLMTCTVAALLSINVSTIEKIRSATVKTRAV